VPAVTTRSAADAKLDAAKNYFPGPGSAALDKALVNR
jgi:hypothetical protein